MFKNSSLNQRPASFTPHRTEESLGRKNQTEAQPERMAP